MLNEVSDAPELTPLERAVLDIALAGDDPPLIELRRQIDGCRAQVRTPSGVGFMTKLMASGQAEQAGGAGSRVPVVYGEHPALSSGAEFIVEVKDGRINCIEAFCYEGVWPSDESLFRIPAGSG